MSIKPIVEITCIYTSIKDILSDETKETRKQYSTIAATCIRHLSERSTILSKRYIFDQIMEPLIRLTQKDLSLKKG